MLESWRDQGWEVKDDKLFLEERDLCLHFVGNSGIKLLIAVFWENQNIQISIIIG